MEQSNPGVEPMMRLGNPVVPVLGARIRRAIGRLSSDEIDRLGGDGALARIAGQAQLSALSVDTQGVHWNAGAAVCDGRPALRVEAAIRYAGDRGMLATMAWGTPDAVAKVAITDTALIVSASGAVDDPEELVGPVRAMIERIERIVAIQAQHVDQANQAARPLAALLLRRRVRRDAAASSANRAA